MDKVISNKVDWSSTDVSGFTTSGSSHCPRCCKPYYTLYPQTTDGGVCECTDEIKSTPTVSPGPPKQYGWICPACGCGNASWASKCGHCRPRSQLRDK